MSLKEQSQFGSISRRRVFLVRHGEVSYFDSDGRPFRPDTVPLNDEGRSQAAALAQVLAGVPIERVISSGLPRTDQTAEILVRTRGLTIETREELREIRPGRLADLPLESIEQEFVGAFARQLDRETRFLGGETFGSLLDRVVTCFRAILADASWQRLLIVAHGGVNRAILGHAMDQGLGGFGAIEQDAGCINIMDVDAGGRFLVRLLNFTPYNPAKTGLVMTTMERLFHDYCMRKK